MLLRTQVGFIEGRLDKIGRKDKRVIIYGIGVNPDSPNIDDTSVHLVDVLELIEQLLDHKEFQEQEVPNPTLSPMCEFGLIMHAANMPYVTTGQGEFSKYLLNSNGPPEF